jgi:ribonuclease-3
MAQADSDRIAELEVILGHDFHDRELLRQAVRHGSASAATDGGSYQRLEFLGDAVLGHALALMLYERFPDLDQGDLTRMRAHLARSSTLSEMAALLGLEKFVELGPSEQMSHGRERHSLLEDVFEAVIGAIALDGGWQAAFDFVHQQFAEDLEDLDERTLTLANPKTALQEAAQARGLPVPDYQEVGATGPDHRRTWAFEVVWDGEVIARGEGRSKRDAQQRAARRALIRLGLVPVS